MTLKNIGVFVDATPEGEKRIDFAATLAHRCGAHLVGIDVVSAVRKEHRSDYYVVGEKAIRASLAARKAADEAATTNVRRRFEAISARRDLSAEFRVIRRGGPDEELILSSLHSDLVVIGQRELQELPGYLAPEKLLLASGAPILVVPSGWKSEPIGKNILVGWNASREAGARSRMRSPSSSRLARSRCWWSIRRSEPPGTVRSRALISPSISPVTAPTSTSSKYRRGVLRSPTSSCPISQVAARI